MLRQHDQVAIAKAVADLVSLTEQAVCSGGIAADYPLQRDGKEQIAVLDTLLMSMLEQLAGARDPGIPAVGLVARSLAGVAVWQADTLAEPSQFALGGPAAGPGRDNVTDSLGGRSSRGRSRLLHR